MCNALELRLIPACIPVIRTTYITILYIERSVSSADVNRECSLQQLMALMAVCIRHEINSAVICIQDNILVNGGIHILPSHVKHQTNRSALFDFKTGQSVNDTHLFLIVDLDIPCVIAHRLIFKYLQNVAALSGCKHLTVIFFIIQSGNLTGFIKLNQIKRSFNLMSVYGKCRILCSRCFFQDNRNGAHCGNLRDFHKKSAFCFLTL